MFRLGFGVVIGLMAGPALACPAPPMAEMEIHLRAVNTERAKSGRVALTLSPDLNAVAQAHACDMAQRGYFSHTTPEGRDMIQRGQRAGLTGICAMGENIARGQKDVPAVMAGWMRSTGHRRNILNSEYRVVGFGRGPGPTWVQVFAVVC